MSTTGFFLAIHLYFLYQPFIIDHLLTYLILLSLFKALLIFFIRPRGGDIVFNQSERSFITNWVFIGFNEMVGIVARWLDKIFLLYLLSPANFAIFFNGAFEIPLFGIAISAMESIMLTHISKDLSNRAAAVSLFRESFKILSLMAFPVFFSCSPSTPKL